MPGPATPDHPHGSSRISYPPGVDDEGTLSFVIVRLIAGAPTEQRSKPRACSSSTSSVDSSRLPTRSSLGFRSDRRRAASPLGPVQRLCGCVDASASGAHDQIAHTRTVKHRECLCSARVVRPQAQCAESARPTVERPPGKVADVHLRARVIVSPHLCNELRSPIEDRDGGTSCFSRHPLARCATEAHGRSVRAVRHP